MTLVFSELSFILHLAHHFASFRRSFCKSFAANFIFITDFVAWIVTFYQLMLVVMGVMHEADSAYSIRSTWLCYRLVRFLITAYIC